MLLIANHNGYWTLPQFENWLRSPTYDLRSKWRGERPSDPITASLASIFCWSSCLVSNCSVTRFSLRCNELQCRSNGLAGRLMEHFTCTQDICVDVTSSQSHGLGAISNSIYHGTPSFCDGAFYKIYLVRTRVLITHQHALSSWGVETIYYFFANSKGKLLRKY